jgi:hypothetical protein
LWKDIQFHQSLILKKTLHRGPFNFTATEFWILWLDWEWGLKS